MTTGLWPLSPSEIAEGARLEMDGVHVTDFLDQVIDTLRSFMAAEGFVVDGQVMDLADRRQGQATRTVEGTVTTRAGGELTGMKVGACLCVAVKAGAKSKWVRLTYQVGDGGPLPVMTSPAVAVKLKLASPHEVTSGLLLQGPLAEMATLCKTKRHARLASQFCAQLADRLSP